jgi:hypothetical protein
MSDTTVRVSDLVIIHRHTNGSFFSFFLPFAHLMQWCSEGQVKFNYQKKKEKREKNKNRNPCSNYTAAGSVCWVHLKMCFFFLLLILFFCCGGGFWLTFSSPRLVWESFFLLKERRRRKKKRHTTCVSVVQGNRINIIHYFVLNWSKSRINNKPAEMCGWLLRLY